MLARLFRMLASLRRDARKAIRGVYSPLHVTDIAILATPAALPSLPFALCPLPFDERYDR